MFKFNILLDIDNLTINDVENQNKTHNIIYHQRFSFYYVQNIL